MTKQLISEATLDEIIVAYLAEEDLRDAADDAMPMVLKPDAKTLELSPPQLEAAHLAAERLANAAK
jgi:hypothetical protein